MASKAKKLEKKVLKALEKENRKTLEELNRLNPPKDDPQVQTLPQQDDLLGIFPGMKKKVLAKKSTFTVKLRRSFADTKKPSIEEDKPEPITIVERKSKKVEQNASVPTMDDAGPELEQGGSKPGSRPSLDTKPSSVRSRSKSGRGRSRSRSESRDTKPRSVRSRSKSGRRRSRSRSRSPGWSGRGWKRSKSPGKIKAAASKRRGETLCRFFAQGRCSRGDRCAYLHSYAAVHAALAAQADDVEDAAGKRESSKRRTMEKSSRSNSHSNRNKSGDGKDVLAAYSKLQSQYDSMVSQSVNKDRPKSKEEKHQKEQPSILPGESTQTDSQDQHKSRTTATSNISDGKQDDSKRSDPRESELGALFQAERRQPTRTIDLRAGPRAELRPQRMGIEPGDDSGVGAFLATQRAHHSSSGGEKGRQETRSADKDGRIQKKRSRSTESTEDARRGQREKATNEKDSSRGSERKDRQAERAKKPERGSLSAKTGGAKEAIKWKGTATKKKKLNQGSSAADRWDPEPEDTNDVLLPTKKQKKKKKEKEKKKKRHSGDKDEGSPVGPSISVQEEGPALPPQNSSDDDSSDDEGLGLAGGVYATALYVGDGVPMHEQGPKGKKRRKRKGEDSENGAFYAPPATLYQPEGEEQSLEQHVGEEHRETSELLPEDEGKKQEDDPRGELFRQYLAYGQKFLRPRRPAASSAHATSPRLAGSQAPSNQAGQGPMPVSSQSWPPATLAATPSGVSTAPSTLHPPVGPGMSWQTSASVQDRSTEVPAAPERMADAVTHHQASPAPYLKHSVSPIVKEVSAMEGLNVEPPQDGMSWSTQSAQRALEPTPAVPVQPEHQQPSLAWSSYMPPEVANILMGIPAAPKPEPAPEQPQPAKAQNEKVVESAPEQNQVTLGSNEEEEEEYDPYPDAQSPPPSPPESNNDAPGNLAQSSTALPAPTNPTRPEPSTLAQPVAPTGPPIVVGTMLVGTKVEKPKALEARPPSAPPPKKQATGAGWGGLSKKEDSQSATSQPQIVWVNQATAAAAAGAGAWGGLTKAPDHTSWGAPRPAGHGGYFLPGPAPTGAKSTAAGAAAGAAKKGVGAAATVAGAVRPAAAVLPSRLPRARAAAPKAKPKAPPTSSGAGLGGLGKAQKIAVEEEKKAAGWGGLGKAVVKEGAGGADAKKVGAPKVPKPVKPQPAPAEAERSVTRFAAMLESFIDEEDEVPARPQVALPSASAPEIALPPGALIDRSGAPPPTAVQQTAITAEHTEKKGPPPSMTARAVLGAADTKALDNRPLSDPSRPPVLGPLYYAAPQASAGLGGTFYFAAPHQAAAGIGSLATPSWAFLDPTLAAAAGPPVGTGPVPSLAFTDPAMVAGSMAAAKSSGPLMTREQFEELQRQEKLALERRAKLKELQRQEKLALERRAKLKELINKK